MNVIPYLYSENFAEQQLFFDSLAQAVLSALSDNGWTVPQLTTAQITAITIPYSISDINAYMPNGTIWYNTDLNKLQVQTAIVLGTGATVETITSV